MKISIFNRFGALNSQPVFQAFVEGAKKNGHTIVEHDLTADVAVIWSMLWLGRMKGNQAIYNNFIKQNKPVIVLEVGCLKRNETWKVGINGLGINSYNWSLNIKRPVTYNVLKDYSLGENVLICTQNPHSEQWKNQPSVQLWSQQIIEKVRSVTNRTIILRSHPRYPVNVSTRLKNVVIQKPSRFSFDDEFISSLSNSRVVINHNSNPAILAAIHGIPVITDQSSLAYPVSQQNYNIETPVLYDREPWYERLKQTEFTCNELSNGEVTDHLFYYIKSNYLK